MVSRMVPEIPPFPPHPPSPLDEIHLNHLSTDHPQFNQSIIIKRDNILEWWGESNKSLGWGWGSVIREWVVGYEWRKVNISDQWNFFLILLLFSVCLPHHTPLYPHTAWTLKHCSIMEQISSTWDERRGEEEERRYRIGAIKLMPL